MSFLVCLFTFLPGPQFVLLGALLVHSRYSSFSSVSTGYCLSSRSLFFATQFVSNVSIRMVPIAPFPMCASRWADFKYWAVLGVRILHGSKLSGVIAANRSQARDGTRQHNERRQNSATEHRWGRIWALLDAILFWDQGSRRFRPNRLSLGLLSIPHCMCLLVILESDISITFRISMLPLSRKCLLCLSPPHEAVGFEGGFASC